MTFKTSLLALSAIVSAASPLLPVHAQASEAPISGRTLTIFGNDTCPRDQICVRAPESERYRIPEKMRKTENKPGDEPWSDRAASVASAGAGGIGSCSATGPGGSTGCLKQQIQAAKSERRQEADQAPVIDSSVQ